MNIHEALGVVTELRRRVLTRQRFRGYSGLARAGGGTIALLASAIARIFGAGANDTALIAIWGLVFCTAFSLNYGAVLWWRIKERAESEALAPALEPLPILLVGGMITGACIAGNMPTILPGIWMSIFALTNFTGKYALPQKIRIVGWFYIVAGAFCFSFGDAAWRNPTITGGIFFIGEWLGGLILHRESSAKFARLEPGNFTPVFNDDEN